MILSCGLSLVTWASIPTRVLSQDLQVYPQKCWFEGATDPAHDRESVIAVDAKTQKTRSPVGAIKLECTLEPSQCPYYGFSFDDRLWRASRETEPGGLRDPWVSIFRDPVLVYNRTPRRDWFKERVLYKFTFSDDSCPSLTKVSAVTSFLHYLRYDGAGPEHDQPRCFWYAMLAFRMLVDPAAENLRPPSMTLYLRGELGDSSSSSLGAKDPDTCTSLFSVATSGRHLHTECARLEQALTAEVEKLTEKLKPHAIRMAEYEVRLARLEPELTRREEELARPEEERARRLKTELARFQEETSPSRMSIARKENEAALRDVPE